MPFDPVLLPIGEVTRLTGVNPATLRAWERRYGLIVPQRTGKGHRLYTQDHVQRIRQILRWLNHGVAVGQVKVLLNNPSGESEKRIGNDWANLQQQLIEAIVALAERRLDQQLNQVMALYPATTLCEHLLMPLLGTLELRWQGRFGARQEQVFFCFWLRSKLGARIHHNNQPLGGPPLLVVNGSTLEFDPQLWLCAWLASDAGCPVAILEWSVPASELAIAVARIQPRALLLCLGKAVNLRQLERSLIGIEVPTFLSGSAVSIHRQAIEAWMHADLQLSVTPLAALEALQRLQVTRGAALDREAPCN